MPNPVMQFQIITKEPDASARFYSGLFDWKIDADNPMGYRRINTGSTEGIHGGIWPAPPQAPTFVQLFIALSCRPADCCALLHCAPKFATSTPGARITI